MKKRVEYGNLSELIKRSVKKENTEIEGVMNYELKPAYAPVLDRKFIDKFNPKKTCISICGNEKFDFDEDKLINQAIEQVKELKEYHKSNRYGMKEHIGEFSIFQNIEVDDFIVDSYSFGKDDIGEYYLILWFTHFCHNFYKHIFWYGNKKNDEWY